MWLVYLPAVYQFPIKSTIHESKCTIVLFISLRIETNPQLTLRKCPTIIMAGQPTPNVEPPRNSRPYEGLINPWFPLI